MILLQLASSMITYALDCLYLNKVMGYLLMSIHEAKGKGKKIVDMHIYPAFVPIRAVKVDLDATGHSLPIIHMPAPTHLLTATVVVAT